MHAVSGLETGPVDKVIDRPVIRSDGTQGQFVLKPSGEDVTDLVPSVVDEDRPGRGIESGDPFEQRIAVRMSR